MNDQKVWVLNYQQCGEETPSVELFTSEQKAKDWLKGNCQDLDECWYEIYQETVK